VVRIITTSHGINRNSVGMVKSAASGERRTRPDGCHGGEMWPLCNAPKKQRFFAKYGHADIFPAALPL
jgi:hypothetical protein